MGFLGRTGLLSAVQGRWHLWNQYDDVISYCGTSSHYHNIYNHNHHYNNYYNYHNNNNRDNFNHHRDNFNYHRDNFNHHSTRNYHRKYSISWGHQKCMEFGRGTFFYEFTLVS